jgi:ABC-type glycerol-3-phosphate transport system substrate-binding protein
MRRILLALAVAALMAVMAAGSAAAQEGPPVGGCPDSYEPGLVTVEFVLAGTGLEEPDASMDPNGDGYTCLKILDTGSGTRATWHDNVIPQ